MTSPPGASILRGGAGGYDGGNGGATTNSNIKSPSIKTMETNSFHDNVIDLERNHGGNDDSISDFDEDNSISKASARSSTVTGQSVTTRSEEEAELAGKETATVVRLRFLIAGILLAVVGIAVAGYLYLQGSNQDAFVQEFQAQASKVVDGFRSDGLNKLQSLQALSSSLTSYAADSDVEWPYLRIQNSAQFFDPYLKLSGAASIVLMPIVGARQRIEWESFSVDNADWIDEDLETRRRQSPNDRKLQADLQERPDILISENGVAEDPTVISPYIKNYVGLDVTPGPYITWWQYAPVITNRWFVNFNRLAFDFFEKESQGLLEGKAAVSSTQSFNPGLDFQSTRDFTFLSDLLEAGGNLEGYTPGEPIGYIYYPIFRNFESDSDAGDDDDVVAILMMTVYWKDYFQGILPENTKGIVCVVENNLDQVFTYQINGKDAEFMGMEDLHDSQYNDEVVTASFSFDDDKNMYSGAPLDETTIKYQIRIYPSSEFEEDYKNPLAIIFTSVMLFIFLLTILVFVAYDRVVQKRQDVVMAAAERSGAVLASLFPKAVRARLLDEAQPIVKPAPGKSRLKKYLHEGDENTVGAFQSKPIADLFPDVTVIMCDLVGFTAWSSTREPEQVFTLLETMYQAFDVIAKKRGVFKIETVGDCYVAVCGLPDPNKQHAVVMAKFARECFAKMREVLERLEVHLGPDTTDLSMRFGLHSGPVTAGVLRGERSRFQLFGDTVNTTSRMESSGLPGKIHVSEVCANLLIRDGKASWLTKREGKCELKGLGSVATYWLKERDPRGSVGGSGSDSAEESNLTPILRESKRSDKAGMTKKTKSLIQWNVEALSKLLKQIIAHRGNSGRDETSVKWHVGLAQHGGTVIDEVQEIVSLPKLTRKGRQMQHMDISSITLSPEVEDQLTDFVTHLAGMYRANPFHNFEHASHVTLSVNKLLSRIVAPSDVDYDEISSQRALASRLHDHTYGITSDPLTQFACVFSALIHDADHNGVPNAQLVKEETEVADFYNNVSVAEQNSIDLAWELLMSDRFKALRRAIAQTEAEVERFRQLVVNVVLATDIVDKDLKALRNERWDRAFSTDVAPGSSSSKEEIDRKATIVIEHLIQASDVAHTMQHWHVYRKWNAKLFKEMSKAYKEGRADTDPAVGWYKGEIGFFDFYIIPLAKKLKECGVFGVSSDEYLNYAMSNRKEWEEKGEQVVAELVQEFQTESH